MRKNMVLGTDTYSDLLQIAHDDLRRRAGYTPDTTEAVFHLDNSFEIVKHDDHIMLKEQIRENIYATERIPYVPRLTDIKSCDQLPRINGIQDEWFYHSIDYVPPFIKTIHEMLGNRAIIAGGAALYCNRDNHERWGAFRDVDVWAFDDETYCDLKERFQYMGWNPNTKHITINNEWIQLDLQPPKFDTIEALIDDFDLSICQVWIDFELRYLRSHNNDLWHIELRNPHSPIRTMKRLAKYARRGFKVSYFTFDILDAMPISETLKTKWLNVIKLTYDLLEPYGQEDVFYDAIHDYLCWIENDEDYDEYHESGGWDDEGDPDYGWHS